MLLKFFTPGLGAYLVRVYGPAELKIWAGGTLQGCGCPFYLDACSCNLQ